jgi:hypothetical protein
MKKIKKKLSFSGNSQVLSREQLKMVLGGANASSEDPGGTGSEPGGGAGITYKTKYEDTNSTCNVTTKPPMTTDVATDIVPDIKGVDNQWDG